ncbi:MBL fold metallo-hydrolase [Curtobacterium sp. VKM Ac-2922]|uniref:MBL fold metallo-hydrolase n=1 Tax=Curtobacterium sp. VKM Ac-2922 TaxID=2929475 RepID=UPI001FB436BC|nr:MBL fold metallo-hydrolase [Curtobacterium sp. VKM Ac-2922]MCJ1716014.1 MBL fold metallo-hydrolase [Curtobacterium sp. VKM Ac-2922]
MGSLRAFACGTTSHGMHQLLRGAARERRVFPAGVFLYESGVRRVLFDTGYAAHPWKTGAAGWAYRRLLPPDVPPGSTIAAQVDPATITHVVLSHLHPDHVGGLRSFPDATLVVTEAVRRAMQGPRIRDGVLRGLLPTTPRPGSVQVVPRSAFRAGPLGLGTVDLFDDGSWQLVDLPGHADGHVGALVEDRVLLAGDAAWGRDLLGQEHRIRAVPRAVAHDADAQARTAQALLDAERSGVRLLFSHDPHPTDVDLLAP